MKLVFESNYAQLPNLLIFSIARLLVIQLWYQKSILLQYIEVEKLPERWISYVMLLHLLYTI